MLPLVTWLNIFLKLSCAPRYLISSTTKMAGIKITIFHSYHPMGSAHLQVTTVTFNNVLQKRCHVKQWCPKSLMNNCVNRHQWVNIDGNTAAVLMVQLATCVCEGHHWDWLMESVHACHYTCIQGIMVMYSHGSPRPQPFQKCSLVHLSNFDIFLNEWCIIWMTSKPIFRCLTGNYAYMAHTCQGYPGYFWEPHWAPRNIQGNLTGMMLKAARQ